jgi:hypothetical protein
MNDAFEPLPTVGTARCVSTHPTGTAIWQIRADANDATLGPEVCSSWEGAKMGLTRSLPVLWQSISDKGRLPGLRFESIWVERGFARRVSAVEGPSFGLSFALVLTSRLSDIPVRPEYVASAAVDPTGRVLPVGDLREKVLALRARVATPLTLLVASEQEDDARELADGGLRIVGVANIAAACEEVFGDALVRRLLQLGGTETRPAILNTLFRIALKGRSEFVDWTPIRRAADFALNHWLDVPSAQVWILEFVRGVAARHQHNAGEIPIPNEDMRAQWPRALWLEILAHLLQQAADSGDPSPKTVKPLAERELPSDLRRALAAELHVAGALGRVEAVTGCPEQALARQAAVAQVHWDTFAWNDMSRPLSEWLRLSGTCDAAQELARAETMFEEAKALGALDGQGLAYVELSWARASVMLAIDRSDRPQKVLERLASNAVIDSVRWSAVRWLARWYATTGRRAEAQQQLDRLEQEGGEAGRTPFLLAQLDVAMMGGHKPATELLDELRRLEPGVVGHLLQAATRGSEVEYVARFYPY